MDSTGKTRITSYQEFWPFYLEQHSKPLTKTLHVVGFACGMIVFISAFVTGRWWLVLIAAPVGYLFAWFSHFTVEKNRPATFDYPLWSFISEFRLVYYWLLRKF